MSSNPKYVNKHRSDKILMFLADHPLISRSALCASIDFKVSDFEKVVEGKMFIMGKWLDAFEAALEKYDGYHDLNPNKTNPA